MEKGTLKSDGLGVNGKGRGPPSLPFYLSPVHTVAENGDCRRFFAVFGDSVDKA